PAGRGRPSPFARDRPEADRPGNRRPLARLLRRARRQRAEAEPRTRQGAELLMARASAGVFSKEIVFAAIKGSFPKLDPRTQIRNPVMFIVELGSVITTVIFFLNLFRGNTGDLWFVAVISIWLWLTVLFANFAEAVA